MTRQTLFLTHTHNTYKADTPHIHTQNTTTLEIFINMPFSGVSLIGLLDSTGLFRHVPHATYSGFKVEREVKLHLRTAKHSLEEPVPKTINSENVKNEISQLNLDQILQ